MRAGIDHIKDTLYFKITCVLAAMCLKKFRFPVAHFLLNLLSNFLSLEQIFLLLPLYPRGFSNQLSLLKKNIRQAVCVF